tara:strand:+ start:5415 stop:6482 length:1068 start_codon:yes stop_codon:yes gene_type:complete
VIQFQNLWVQLPIPSLVIGNDNSIQEINPAGEQFLGISSKVILGQHVWNYLRGEDLLPAGIERARALKRPILIGEVAAHGRNTKARTCAAHVCPLNGNNQQILILLIAHETIGNSGNGLAPMLAAHSAIGMAELLAHEIKNPLAGIIGAAQFLSMSRPKGDHEMTDLIVEESKRIVALLDQVEHFGDVTPPNCVAVNIHDVLDQAVRSATFGFAGNIKIFKNYDPSLPNVWADPDQLVQVFLNLIKNACEALADEGQISVRTFYDPNLRLVMPDSKGQRLPLHVDIKDNGPGLPDGLARHVFEPFVSSKSNGKGLGLALVSKIVAQHSAWVSAASRPGQTIFRISLPVKKEKNKE